jgi:hypothetical protein
MILISHRGNVSGTNEFLENHPIHIISLIKKNIQVEIDVWLIDGALMLGHDNPNYNINLKFLKLKGLWCHAKNLEALKYMADNKIENYFWHENDNYTLTSSGFIWTYPNKSVVDRSIIVDFDKDWKSKNYNCYGVCVDYL